MVFLSSIRFLGFIFLLLWFQFTVAGAIYTPKVVSMGTKPWLHPAPQYKTLETFWDDDDDAPGPRCAHTLTAVAATKTHGPRLILFGGATAIEGGNSSVPGISK